MLVKFFGSIRDVTGVKEMELNGIRIEDILEQCVKIYGDEFKKQIYNGRKLRDGIQILLNGRNIIYLKILKTAISNEDTISIFPPAGGG